MGMDLINVEGDNFRWSLIWWAGLLNLAEYYGWKRMGTVIPDDLNWDGSYMMNDGQIVTTADAAGLANALERALPDVPEDIDNPIPIPDSVVEALTRSRQRHSRKYLLLMFSGEVKDSLRQFILFCRKGGFGIL